MEVVGGTSEEGRKAFTVEEKMGGQCGVILAFL